MSGMGRKSSAKQSGSQGARPPAELRDKKGLNPMIIVGVAIVAIAGAFLVMRESPGTSSSPAGSSASAAAQEDPAAASMAKAGTPEAVAKAAALAAMGPHKQASLPPIPFQAYQPPRPREVITEAYHFAAEHPEILSYVPCFCGCELSGHDGNHACFVKSRAPNGDVVEWDEHGVECAVCIDVATRSRQLHASGASVRDIRATIEKEFKPHSPRITPTPTPPGTSAENLHAH
jgi:hypothetical protein